jgi:sortase (surface protein transpeptidase)
MINLPSWLKSFRPPSNFIYLGIFLLGFTMIILASQPFLKILWSSFWETQTQAIYPMPIETFLAKLDSAPKILGDFTQLPIKDPVIMTDFDSSNLESWFTSGKVKAQRQTQEAYLLHIDKLGITNALVKVGGNNIDQNLVQFNTDTHIGGYGAPVIFGHSILRQFYNPKESNKDRYKSIFSTIMTLQNGDEIKITAGEITYTYLVTDKKEVKPDDDYILAQNQNLKQIKLVTCTPEGTFLRRGVITAELKL